MKVMRILHLATSSSGGAGTAAVRLHKGLQELGIDSVFICRENLHEFVEISQVSKVASTTLSKCLSYLQIPGRISKGSLVTPFQIDFLKPFLQEIGIEKFDVVHIHAPYNFVGEASIREIADRTIGKLVITLHDQRFFTGGCHYSEGCRNFEDNCQRCPQVKILFRHSIAQEHTRKMKLFAGDRFGDKLVFVAPSKWIADEAIRSTIAKNSKIEILHNGIPKIFFDAASKRNWRRRKVVGFSSVNLQNPYKGLRYLMKAMIAINDATDQKFELSLLGSGAVPEHKFPIMQRIANSDSEIVDFLSGIDVLAVPSLQDNLPSVVLEALAAGVPVVGASVGGIAELLDFCRMPKARPQDSESLAEELRNVLESDEGCYRPERISKIIEREFAIENVAKKYLRVYLGK